MDTVYHIEQTELSDRYPIDFEVLDTQDNLVASVWGNDEDRPEVECSHQLINFGDDDEVGVCEICGAECSWHYEKQWFDMGHDDDGGCVGKEIEERVPDGWSFPFKHKSFIMEHKGEWR